MMKNSKLSKLLVAGVSVAMLASAVAPMAFADEASVTTDGPEIIDRKQTKTGHVEGRRKSLKIIAINPFLYADLGRFQNKINA